MENIVFSILGDNFIDDGIILPNWNKFITLIESSLITYLRQNPSNLIDDVLNDIYSSLNGFTFNGYMYPDKSAAFEQYNKLVFIVKYVFNNVGWQEHLNKFVATGDISYLGNDVSYGFDRETAKYYLINKGYDANGNSIYYGDEYCKNYQLTLFKNNNSDWKYQMIYFVVNENVSINLDFWNINELKQYLINENVVSSNVDWDELGLSFIELDNYVENIIDWQDRLNKYAATGDISYLGNEINYAFTQIDAKQYLMSMGQDVNGKDIYYGNDYIITLRLDEYVRDNLDWQDRLNKYAATGDISYLGMSSSYVFNQNDTRQYLINMGQDINGKDIYYGNDYIITLRLDEYVRDNVDWQDRLNKYVATGDVRYLGTSSSYVFNQNDTKQYLINMGQDVNGKDIYYGDNYSSIVILDDFVADFKERGRWISYLNRFLLTNGAWNSINSHKVNICEQEYKTEISSMDLNIIRQYLIDKNCLYTPSINAVSLNNAIITWKNANPGRRFEKIVSDLNKYVSCTSDTSRISYIPLNFQSLFSGLSVELVTEYLKGVGCYFVNMPSNGDEFILYDSFEAKLTFESLYLQSNGEIKWDDMVRYFKPTNAIDNFRRSSSILYGEKYGIEPGEIGDIITLIDGKNLCFRIHSPQLSHGHTDWSYKIRIEGEFLTNYVEWIPNPNASNVHLVYHPTTSELYYFINKHY